MLWTARRNPFAFPAGRTPGFNPLHPAAKNCRISCVARGNSMVNLMTGKAATTNGTVTAGSHGILGPNIYNGNGGPVQFTGLVADGTGSTQSRLMGIIFYIESSEGIFRSMFSTSSTGNGQQLWMESQSLAYNDWASNRTYFATIANNTPYFAAVCNDNNTGDLRGVATNLSTGQIESHASLGIEGISATDGVVEFLYSSVITNPTTGYHIHAAMFGVGTPTFPEMLKWAEDPWSFWYPRIAMPYYRAPTVYHMRPDGDVAIGNWTRG